MRYLTKMLVSCKCSANNGFLCKFILRPHWSCMSLVVPAGYSSGGSRGVPIYNSLHRQVTSHKLAAVVKSSAEFPLFVGMVANLCAFYF